MERPLNHPEGRSTAPWSSGQGTCWALVVAVCLGSVASLQADEEPPRSSAERGEIARDRPAFAGAQSLFYTARYEEAAALTLVLRSPETEELASYELPSPASLRRARRTPGDDERVPANGRRA
jgi:hypothetical protein